jgi:hypothetical protein
MFTAKSVGMEVLMHPIRTPIVASALVLAGLALSTPAHALSCLWGVHTASVEEGEVVPANAVFLVEHTYDESTAIDVVLEDAAGEPVQLAIEAHHHYALLRPEAALAPGDYRITTLDEFETWFDISFTVGADRDADAPDLPVFTRLDRQFDATEWGDTKGISVELAEVEGAAWYEFEISESADFADAHRVASVYPSAFLGQGLCEDAFPDYRHRDRYHVRARAVDAAGNASDWAKTDGPVRGCSTVGPAPLLLGLPIGLLAMATRRRR